MALGRSAATACATAVRSSTSTPPHETRPSLSGGRLAGFDQAATDAPASSRCSTRWPPAKPPAPVTRTGPTALRFLASAVLRLIVLLERHVVVLDRPPPPLVRAVPGHRLGEPGVEGDQRGPPERVELGGVERIPAVVAGPILDVADQRLGLVQERENPMREHAVRDRVRAADVV